MLSFIVAIFLILHGLVHLLYAGQSSRIFELQPGMVWPDGSWAFSKILGDEPTRHLAAILLVLAAIAFAAGGAGIFVKQSWWRTMVVGASIGSSILYVLLWDGGLQRIDEKGAVGILINIVILVAVLVLRWPEFDF